MREDTGNKAATIEELRIEVDNLKAQIKANETRGQQAKVNTGTGISTVATLRGQLSEMTQDLLMSTAQLKRENDEAERRNPVPHVTPDNQLEWRTPGYRNPPLLTIEAAQKLHGLAVWAKLSNAQKAQARDIRESDLQGIKIEDIFGSKSSSAKAVALGRSNPTAYKILKQRAIEQGIF